jgi:transcriptional regulator with XRE-family HTH domain
MTNIQKMRKAAKLSQYELAQRCGINRTRLSLAECGYTELRPVEESAIRAAIADIIKERLADVEYQLRPQVSA